MLTRWMHLAIAAPLVCAALSCNQPEDDDDEPVSPTPAGDTSPGDDDTGSSADDSDGDGYPAWNISSDPLLADCDDNDPAVNPLTERFIPDGWFLRGDDGQPEAAPAREIFISAYCMEVVELSNERFVAWLNERIDAGLGERDDLDRPLYDFEDVDDTIPQRLLRDSDGHVLIEPGYEEHPVVEVWQYSSQEYCAAHGMRLPTEAEWERGARGDEDDRPYPWGYTAPTCEYANYSTLTFNPDGTLAEATQCAGDTRPVGSNLLNASPFGLLDMAGNVGEWVSDAYSADYYAASPDHDPLGPVLSGSQSSREIIERGGNWANDVGFVRVFMRYPNPDWATSNGVGFRCVRPLDPL